DLARASVAHGLEQALVALDVVGEAELRRRDAELRRGAAIAQVAGERDLDAAAEAEAVDHRERRLRRPLDGVQHAVEEIVVVRYGAAIRASLLKLGNVRAGGEGLRAGAAKCDTAHLGISVEAIHALRNAGPHALVERV